MLDETTFLEDRWLDLGKKQGVPESKVKSCLRRSKAGIQDLGDLKTCSLLWCCLEGSSSDLFLCWRGWSNVTGAGAIFLGYMMKQNQGLILTIPPNTFFEHLQVKKNGNFIMKYLSVFGLNFPTKLEAQAKMFFPVSAPCYKKYVTFSLTGCCGRHCHQVQTLWCWCSNTAGPSPHVRIKLLIL